MADVFRVRVEFTRQDPVTGEMVEYKRGDLIAHPDRIADILGSDHEPHGHMTVLADDHPAVLPHLPEGHPAVQAFLASVKGPKPPVSPPKDVPPQ